MGQHCTPSAMFQGLLEADCQVPVQKQINVPMVQKVERRPTWEVFRIELKMGRGEGACGMQGVSMCRRSSTKIRWFRCR